MKLSLSKDLAPLKLVAISKIDAAAGAARLSYITSAPGQEMVYGQKQREAEAFLRDIDQRPSGFRHLVKEAALNGITPYEQAVEWVTMEWHWSEASSDIEIERLRAKQAVERATTPAEISAVAFNWPAR